MRIVRVEYNTWLNADQIVTMREKGDDCVVTCADGTEWQVSGSAYSVAEKLSRLTEASRGMPDLRE